MSNLENLDPIALFSDYLKVTGVAHIDPEKHGDPKLIGKRLGLINGSSWTTLWANYFGRRFTPGAHLVNVGNEAIQMNFMHAYQNGQPTPPQSNIDAFVRYAHELVEFGQVDAIMITCSTMNRAYTQVQEALRESGVPLVQIDRPMMEAAVRHGGHILVIATHGPTVNSTQMLLRETADDLGVPISFSGVTIEEAWHRLAEGDVTQHNMLLAEAIRKAQTEEKIDSVVLAQLSMTVFLLSYPDPVKEFGIPVYTSGQYGFEYVRELLTRETR
jgi:aspartate/glutamate racemase